MQLINASFESGKKEEKRVRGRAKFALLFVAGSLADSAAGGVRNAPDGVRVFQT
jgi:hypothetical protein